LTRRHADAIFAPGVSPLGGVASQSTPSVASGKWQARADRIWEKTQFARVALHEARHVYASFLMAAGYTWDRSRSTSGTRTSSRPPATSRNS
jgi:hypothetical protein